MAGLACTKRSAINLSGTPLLHKQTAEIVSQVVECVFVQTGTSSNSLPRPKDVARLENGAHQRQKHETCHATATVFRTFTHIASVTSTSATTASRTSCHRSLSKSRNPRARLAMWSADEPRGVSSDDIRQVHT